MGDARRVFDWMAGQLDGRDVAAVARGGLELLLTEPGVLGARVRVAGQDVASGGDPSAPERSVTRGRATVEWAGAEDAEVAASVVALCVERAARESDAFGDRRRLVHDLRGSLAVMAGHCEMLESGVWGTLPAEQLRSVKALSRQVERLKELVERVRETR